MPKLSFGDDPMWSSTTSYGPAGKLVAVGDAMVNPYAVEAIDTDPFNKHKVRIHLTRGSVVTIVADFPKALEVLKDAHLLPVAEGAVRFSAIEALMPGANAKRETKVQLAGGTVLELNGSVQEVAQELKAALAQE